MQCWYDTDHMIDAHTLRNEVNKHILVLVDTRLVAFHWCGRLFHDLAPSYQNDFKPNVVVAWTLSKIYSLGFSLWWLWNTMIKRWYILYFQLFEFRNEKFTHMGIAQGQKWKKLRSIGSQMFMARRMKEVGHLLWKQGRKQSVRLRIAGPHWFRHDFCMERVKIQNKR